MAKRAKKTKTAKAARRRNTLPMAPRRTRRPGGIRVAGVDAGAAMHRNLLLDPCNAPLAAPVYSGLGTGQYRRLRAVIAAEGQSVEGCYVFQLGTNTFWKGSHVAGTAGTPYTFSALPIFTDGSIASGRSVRTIAGCVKVRYVGAESARAGTVGVLAAPSAINGINGDSTAVIDITRCPNVHRTGEVQHEVKFVPNATDEQFAEPTVSGVTFKPTGGNSCLVAVYRAVPAASIQFEVTCVYEIEEAASAGNGVITSVPPSSAITLNQLLRTLGPVTRWAYGNVIAPTLRSMAGPSSSTFLSSAAAASRAIAALTI